MYKYHFAFVQSTELRNSIAVSQISYEMLPSLLAGTL